MKNGKILAVAMAGACLLVAGLSANAALLTVAQDPSSPYYADFSSSGLTISYTTTGTSGTISIHNTTGANEVYHDSSSSPGTGSTYRNTGAGTGFSGSFSLTANVQEVGSVWDVTSGSFSVKGNLLPGGQTGDLLLSGTLRTGAGTLGYSDTGSINSGGHFLGTAFDFLFNASSGNSQILQDFFGNGAGAIIVESGNYNPVDPYKGLGTKFDNLAAGTADAFVPEPGSYGFAAGAVAVMGLLMTNRKKRGGSSHEFVISAV